MKRNSRIKKPALCIGAVFIIVLFIGTTVLMYLTQKQMFIDAQKENLQILADEKAGQIENFLESQKEKLEIISSVGVFKEVVKDPKNPIKIEAAKNRLNELKEFYSGIGVLTKEGIIVVAEKNPAGTDYGSLSVFPADNKSGIVFVRYYDPSRKNDYYAVGGPIYDRIEKDKVIGAIAFDVELDKISALMKETMGNESTEVYLIDETGLLLSGSKYIDGGNKNGVLIQEVKSDGAKVCLEDLKKYGHKENGQLEYVGDHEEKVIQYTNYMGNEVYGAHAYASTLGGCVIAEKSADEILKFSIVDYIKNLFI
jgi:hypothetical protein